MFDFRQFKEQVKTIVREGLEVLPWEPDDTVDDIAYSLAEYAMGYIKALMPQFDNATAIRMLVEFPKLFDETELNETGETVRQHIRNNIGLKCGQEVVDELGDEIKEYLHRTSTRAPNAKAGMQL